MPEKKIESKDERKTRGVNPAKKVRSFSMAAKAKGKMPPEWPPKGMRTKIEKSEQKKKKDAS